VIIAAATPPTKFVIIAMIPMIEPAPHDKLISVVVPKSKLVNALIPSATPMIPKIKQTNARTFPANNTIDLIRSDNANVTSKHIAEKTENKHANVTKAFAAVTLLQVLLLEVDVDVNDVDDVPEQSHAVHCDTDR